MSPKETLMSIALLALSLFARPASADDALTAKQELALEAARALYGEGLTITRSSSGVMIAPKPGGLTQAKFNRYVEEVYLPTLAQMSFVTNGRSFRFLENPREAKYDPQAKTKLAHLLLEPDIKYTLCQKIADVAQIGWRQPYSFASDDRKNWCILHAITEATSPILEYRGAPITWDSKRDRGDLSIDEVIFQKGTDGDYPIIVTVAGARTQIDRSAYRIADQLRGSVGKEGAKTDLLAKIDKLWKTKSRAYNKLVKAAVKEQRGYARKAKVLFSDEYFAEWVARKPAKGPIPCESTHYLAYTPKSGGEGSYAKVMKIDDAICAVVPLDADQLDSGNVRNSMKCGNDFEAGKSYKLTIDIHKRHVTGSHTKVEWRDKTWKNAKYDLSRLGKRLYGSSVTCEN